ncbi:Fungal specific transcription factor domain [Rhizoctonia solani]|uniref:Fungal specific transcription factor domain n=2 Tax=Rhizoctonia solani TaxID=456999 RepID=A0A8H7ILV2_9AGAM|nr:Fungal specific transcription factor domain [Rhizoctonia solani]
MDPARKKCDETKPICTRCSRGDDQCAWRSTLTGPSAVSPQLNSRVLPTYSHGTLLSANNVAMPGFSTTELIQNNDIQILDLGIDVNSFVDAFGSGYAFAEALLANSTFQSPESRPLYNPSQARISILGQDEYTIGTDSFLDDDEQEFIKLPEWRPRALEALSPYIPDTDQANWLNALSSCGYHLLHLCYRNQLIRNPSYAQDFTFISRYTYEPSKLLKVTKNLTVGYIWLSSARLGLLGIAALFHSYINPMASQSVLHERSRQLIEAAITSIQREVAQPGIPINASLAGISMILSYHCFSGNSSAYLTWIETALPMIKALVGSKPVALHRLHGLETIDIRTFVWGDIFTAISSSQPTRLVYDCNAEVLLKKNREGPNLVGADMEIGLEWLCGLPDAMLLLIIQIINLRHSSLPETERFAQAAKIESALRDWKVWPSETTNSVMRVRRMATQEIWRHFTILYLYQAIHKASPSHEVVQHCVSQIFKLGSTLPLGRNPDCLLSVPYFVAGTFAISPKHRQLFRSRLLGCGLEAYGQALAKALEELWQRSLDPSKHDDWTTKSPPIVIFS